MDTKKPVVIFVFLVSTIFLNPGVSSPQSREIFSTDDITITAGGYFKTLATLTGRGASEKWDGAARLRLKTEASYRDRLTAVLHYEVAAIFGESLKNPQTREMLSANPDDFLDLSWVARAPDDAIFRHSLDRAYISLSLESFTLTLGRQRIAWGTAWFVSPTDLFNPFNPTEIDKEEKTGVDAALLEVPLGDYTSLSFVYAPSSSRDNSSYAARFSTNLFDYDVSLLAGRFRGNDVFGFDFAGQIGGVALYGECAYFVEDKKDRYYVTDASSPFGMDEKTSRSDYVRAVIGAQYIFPNTFFLMAEYYYNGKGEAEKSDYNFSALYRGEETSLAQNYAFARLGYEITPLLKGDFSTLFNIDDTSALFAPSLEYSITENTFMAIGAQFGAGASDSEYGSRPDLYYLELRYYF